MSHGGGGRGGGSKKCRKSVTYYLNGPLPSALRHCSGGLEDVDADLEAVCSDCSSMLNRSQFHESSLMVTPASKVTLPTVLPSMSIAKMSPWNLCSMKLHRF
jgi:hypothetical protein